MFQQRKTRSAIFAEANILAANNCITSYYTQHGSEVVEVLNHNDSGWKFHSFHRHILDEQEIRQQIAVMKKQISQHSTNYEHERKSMENDDDDHIVLNNYQLHLPPMFFAADKMLLELPKKESTSEEEEVDNENKSSGPAISIDATDAIYCWIIKHCQEKVDTFPLNVPKVPYSASWVKRTQDISTTSPGASTTTNTTGNTTFTDIKAWDWTFSTDYSCTLLLPNNNVKKQIIAAKEITATTTDNNNTKHSLFVNPLPYQTFHLDSTSSIVNNQQKNKILWQITTANGSGINYDILRNRDLPILFYDELLLYQDDLEDCGEVVMEAKIRVMPSCFFILNKFFLRVDNVLVRTRETRLYHHFINDTDINEENHQKKIQVHVEIIWREEKLAPQVDVVDTSNIATNTARVPSTSNKIMKPMVYTKENSNNLSQVNDQEGIAEFFTLTYTM